MGKQHWDIINAVAFIATLATIVGVVMVLRASEIKQVEDRARLTAIVENLANNQADLIVTVKTLVNLDERTIALQNECVRLEARVERLSTSVENVQQRVAAVEGCLTAGVHNGMK